VREVTARQRARGLDPRVISSDLFTEIPWARMSAKELAVPTSPDGVPVERVHARGLSDDLHYPFLVGLYFGLRRARPDLVHVHTYGTYQGFSATALERLNRVPWVMTAHYHPTWSIWGGPGRKELRGIYDRLCAPRVLRHLSRLILQSPQEEALLREILPELPPISMVPPGYTPLPPPREEAGGFRGAYRIPGPFVLFTGRLASNKGLTLLLEAFRRVHAERQDLSLVLVGEDGGEGPVVRLLAEKLGIAERVHLVGFVADERLLSSAYAQAEVFVLPSEYEAYGLVLLEAMAQGTPVISTRVGGIPALVEDGKNGRLVPPKDPTALAAALEELLGDRAKAREWGRYGKERTVAAHTWERTEGLLERIYLEVLEGRAPGARGPGP
jgi:glycosyltransferase involved in cell wall biosynthesis